MQNKKHKMMVSSVGKNSVSEQVRKNQRITKILILSMMETLICLLNGLEGNKKLLLENCFKCQEMNHLMRVSWRKLKVKETVLS